MKTHLLGAAALSLLMVGGAIAQTAPATPPKAPEPAAGAPANGEPPAQAEAPAAPTPEAKPAEATGQAETAAPAEPAPKPEDAKPANQADAAPKAAPAEIPDADKTVIRETIVRSGVEPVDIDIDINVGTAVPRTVVLHPLPARIIELVPAYADYQYFLLADGTIIIVDPVDYAIIYVIYA